MQNIDDVIRRKQMQQVKLAQQIKILESAAKELEAVSHLLADEGAADESANLK